MIEDYITGCISLAIVACVMIIGCLLAWWLFGPDYPGGDEG